MVCKNYTGPVEESFVNAFQNWVNEAFDICSSNDIV